MRSYYTYGAIPDPVRTVRGFDDGGLAMIEPVGLAGAGGEDKPLMQQLYERGEISDAEYRAWLEGQAAEQSPLSTYPRPPDESTGPSGLEASPYKPPDESAGPSQEYNPVTALPTTIPVQGALEASPYKPPVETAGPSQEYNPVTALPTTIAAPAPVAAPAAPTGLTMKDIFVGGVPAGIDPNAPFAPDPKEAAKALAAASFIDPSSLKGLSGFSADPNVAATAIYKADTSPTGGSQGAIYEAGALENAKAAAAVDPLRGYLGEAYKQIIAENPLAASSVADIQARNLANVAKYEQDYAVMKPLSDLLKANKFQEAFDFARQNGVVDKLMDTRTLKELRPAFTPNEMQAFFAAVPADYAGSKFNFDPKAGVAGSLDPYGTGNVMQSGYPDPTAAFTRKEDKTIENIVKTALAAAALYGGAQFLGGLGGAGGAGAGAAGAGGAGAAGAGAAGAAAGAGALTGAELAEVVVTASKLGMTVPQFLAAVGGTGALSSALGGAGATGQPLQEVVSQASRLPPSTINPYAYPLLASTSVGLPQTGMSDIVPQPEGATPSDLEEVTVQAQRPIDWSWLSGALASAPGLAQIAAQMGAPNIPSLGPPEVVPDQLEEVTIPGQRPIDWSWLNPALAAAPTLAQIASQIGAPNIPELNLEQLNPEDILKDYKPTEIPTSSTLQDLIKKYGTLENALKVLGLLGGAGAVSGGAGGTGLGGKVDVSGGAGFSSGLTPFDYGRRQLSPNIDYYTYATRPEAKFFEYGAQLDNPMQPPPSEPSGVITEAAGGYIDENMTGGLIGYAKGGKPERYVDGPGSGREDLIPAMLSDGEYVIDAETLALLGDGSTKEGARRMDRFRAKIRQHKGRALSRGRISPNAKSPEQYMGGGLT